MSPRHISVDEARSRLLGAKQQLNEAIKKNTMPEDEKIYLTGVLERGEESCQRAEQTLASKQN